DLRRRRSPPGTAGHRGSGGRHAELRARLARRCLRHARRPPRRAARGPAVPAAAGRLRPRAPDAHRVRAAAQPPDARVHARRDRPPVAGGHGLPRRGDRVDRGGRRHPVRAAGLAPAGRGRRPRGARRPRGGAPDHRRPSRQGAQLRRDRWSL
ncbi:MAG: hypothetical protein AVDCRST_MAG85-2154, partial [uncultured Solirubrobacteraceae bacterium]